MRGTKPNATRKIDGLTFKVRTGHNNKKTAQDYAKRLRATGDYHVRVLPAKLGKHKTNSIWTSRRK